MPGQVEVRRSARRRRTVAAHREGDRIVVLIPARFSRAEEARWVERMVQDVLAREDRNRQRGARRSDAALSARAASLSAKYLEGRARPTSVNWVTTMNQRWGSCTPADRSIRISHRLRAFPEWVLDYVLVHELAHLLVDGHGPEFWRYVNRFERTERARGFLEGFASAANLSLGEDDLSPGEDLEDLLVPP